MAEISAQESAEFAGTAAQVYGIIADYHEGHPSILPQRYFTYLEVERGGRGAGTVIRYGVKLAGREQHARAEISEPEPGRVLVERMHDARGTATTFTVDEIGSGRVRVTISTSWRSPGIRGWIEGIIAPPLLRRMYVEQLANLERAAAT